jgi:prepilin-type N-terminal cleavage/methylation domain-containing protein
MRQLVSILRKRKSGFTLLEVILALIVMGIITVTLVPLFRSNIEMYLHTAAIVEAGQSSRIAFNRLIMSMREMNDLNYGTDGSINFDDIDGNTYSYEVSGDYLLMNGSVAAENVSSMVLEYVSTDGSTSAAPDSSTWSIRVTLNFDIMDSPQSYSAEIMPRNWQSGI